MNTLTYNNQLKKLQIQDISFNEIALSELSDPHITPDQRPNTFDFRDELLDYLSRHCGSKVLRLIIISPSKNEEHYHSFIFLENKKIVPALIKESSNFNAWMDIALTRMRDRLAKNKADGLFERQPELNPSPQFGLFLGPGEFSRELINSGMFIDERPFDDTGEYLYERSPRLYNLASTTKEKNEYLKSYVDTSGTQYDPPTLTALFKKYIDVKGLTPQAPANNTTIYTEFSELAGYSIPAELQHLFTLHNGINNNGFLSAEKVLNEWKSWKSIYDSADWDLEELQGNSYSDGEKTLGMYTTPYWIPFYSTGGGNFIGIDYAPNSKGKSGQIIAFGADEDTIRFIADDLQDFLQIVL